MQGDFMPPGADDAQHGMAIIQSIMQFIGQSIHAQPMHGFMHGSMQFMGQVRQSSHMVFWAASRKASSGVLRGFVYGGRTSVRTAYVVAKCDGSVAYLFFVVKVRTKVMMNE